MKGKRYTNEQIIYALKRVEGGEKVSEVCPQMGVSEAGFYTEKKKFSGMGVSELGRAAAIGRGEQPVEEAGRRFVSEQTHSAEVLSKKL